MHGIIHNELQRFAEVRHGPAAWREVVDTAGVPRRFAYVRLGQYPDSELEAILRVLAMREGGTRQTILLDFGEFIVPSLLTMFPKLVSPQWDTLDLIANTEDLMHRIARARDPGAQPPRLQCSRNPAGEVAVVYRSARRMCAFGRGIIHGIAHHYRERVSVTETSCMLRDQDACRLVVRREERGGA